MTYEETLCLPSREEYIGSNENLFNATMSFDKYSEPKYRCPLCGGGMRKNLVEVFASCPPKYQYVCDKCNNVDYLFY